MLFRAGGREKMFANRAYSSGLFASPDRGASLLYFAAAIPAVGFCASGTRGCRRHFLGGPNRRRLATFVGRGREPAACCSSGAGFSFGLKQFPSSDNRACGSGCASPAISAGRPLPHLRPLAASCHRRNRRPYRSVTLQTRRARAPSETQSQCAAVFLRR